MAGFELDRDIMDRRKLPDQIFDIIKKMILSGRLAAGQKIPEESIASSLKVSRTPIREALQKLQQVGIIEIVPRSFARVVKLKPEDRKQIGEVRMQLELLTARLISQTASDNDVASLRKISDACLVLAEKGDKAAVYEKHSEFHLEMARRTGNSYLYDMMKSIDVKVQLLRVSGYVRAEQIIENLSFHPRIIDAIACHDGEEAERLTMEHLENFYFTPR